ncbi:MAG: hypothetical protein N2171_04880 [Clostridia bacterium]|nr:hypothetical protein [Clostridia bacterium]
MATETTETVEDAENTAATKSAETTDTMETAPKFSKEQILLSKKYRSKKDIINVLLDDSSIYSITEVDALIKKFMKGKVN